LKRSYKEKGDRRPGIAEDKKKKRGKQRGRKTARKSFHMPRGRGGTGRQSLRTSKREQARYEGLEEGKAKEKWKK